MIRKFLLDRSKKKGELLHNQYKILQRIGSGSYGIVYKCHDLQSDTIKVIKQLRNSKRRNGEGLKLFYNEIEILCKLDHPNMPAFYEDFSIKKDYFYVMDLITADDLDKQIFLENQTFSEKASLLIVRRLLEMVHYLHSREIYHQDLRIPNIMLKGSEPFLIDFGLAIDASKKVGVADAELEKMRQQDYYDLGDILLFLLYTTYTSNNKKALPWTEELSLEPETTHLLKRLLGIEKTYSNFTELQQDMDNAIVAVGT